MCTFNFIYYYYCFFLWCICLFTLCQCFCNVTKVPVKIRIITHECEAKELLFQAIPEILPYNTSVFMKILIFPSINDFSVNSFLTTDMTYKLDFSENSTVVWRLDVPERAHITQSWSQNDLFFIFFLANQYNETPLPDCPFWLTRSEILQDAEMNFTCTVLNKFIQSFQTYDHNIQMLLACVITVIFYADLLYQETFPDRSLTNILILHSGFWVCICSIRMFPGPEVFIWSFLTSVCCVSFYFINRIIAHWLCSNIGKHTFQLPTFKDKTKNTKININSVIIINMISQLAIWCILYFNQQQQQLQLITASQTQEP